MSQAPPDIQDAGEQGLQLDLEEQVDALMSEIDSTVAVIQRRLQSDEEAESEPVEAARESATPEGEAAAPEPPPAEEPESIQAEPQPEPGPEPEPIADVEAPEIADDAPPEDIATDASSAETAEAAKEDPEPVEPPKTEAPEVAEENDVVEATGKVAEPATESEEMPPIVDETTKPASQTLDDEVDQLIAEAEALAGIAGGADPEADAEGEAPAAAVEEAAGEAEPEADAPVEGDTCPVYFADDSDVPAQLEEAAASVQPSIDDVDAMMAKEAEAQLQEADAAQAVSMSVDINAPASAPATEPAPAEEQGAATTPIADVETGESDDVKTPTTIALPGFLQKIVPPALAVVASVCELINRPFRRMQPGTRSTIGWVALETLFVAACLWIYLIIRG